MEKTQVVDEDHVTLLCIETMVVLGCQRRKNLESIELCRAQRRDRGLPAGLSSCGMKAQTARINADQDPVLANMQQGCNDIARRVSGPEWQNISSFSRQDAMCDGI
jgi:hypothetical protein